MSTFFLILNISLFSCYLLFIIMQLSYFRRLNYSVLIYTNTKIYKTETQTKFIRQLIEDYSNITSQNAGEIDIYIRQRIQRDYIGKFRFSIVENGITKLRRLSYLVVALNVVWYVYSNKDSLFLILNLIIFFIVIIIGILTSLKKRKNDIILILKDYILNQYPLETLQNSQTELNKQLELENARLKESLEIKILTIAQQNKKIAQLEDRISLDEEYFQASHNFEEEKSQNIIPDLNDEDITKFLEEFGI
ncbi:hypothetical protein [Candidatus Epulonipiscium viviparus]|uniref:hypothetical protein n=1 Tax=Candidatus Epulonipiscium viviparus TaxID=420336 RepID=UPI00016C0A33|nr:hypothetical protein [Candidatus Epulopiscium viviparus]